MEYKATQELNLKELQENVKRNGFSDRTKKYIAQVLLAAQIMGATPSLGADGKTATEYDLNNNLNQYGQIQSDEQQKPNLEGMVLDAFTEMKDVDRTNLGEFSERAFNSVQQKRESDPWVHWVTDINDYTIEDMLELKRSGQKMVHFRDADSQHQPYNITQEGFTQAYSPDDMIMIKLHFEKYYGPIRDNPNLSQKEKFHAAMMVLQSLNTYDFQAYSPNKPTEYSEAAKLTSRGQYGSIKYGTMICGGYQDSVKKICDMLGIKCENINGLSGMNVYQNFSPQHKQELLQSMKDGQHLHYRYVNHGVNRITFDDGTSYLHDMTDHDATIENSQKKGFKYDSRRFYLTDLNNFQAILQCDGQLITADPKDRDVSACQVMPREEIADAQEKIKKELPYIAKLQELDKFQRDTGISKSSTGMLFKTREAISNITNKFKDKFMKPKQSLLEQSKGEYIETAEMQIEANNDLSKKDEFRNMISNNGQYRKVVEKYMKNYQEKQGKQENSQVLAVASNNLEMEDDIER